MKYNQLGDSNLKVSEICLGTMTFGQQHTIASAHQQLDFAVESGVNFIDTAEMYPVPPRPDTYSKTETYIGEWLKHQQRDRIIIATKMVGGDDVFIGYVMVMFASTAKISKKRLKLALNVCKPIISTFIKFTGQTAMFPSSDKQYSIQNKNARQFLLQNN